MSKEFSSRTSVEQIQYYLSIGVDQHLPEQQWLGIVEYLLNPSTENHYFQRNSRISQELDEEHL